MSYLISYDYLRLIQTGNLQQIITSNPAVLAGIELTAEAEVKSHLVQKYLVDGEFTDTTLWSKAVIYNANQRVYLDATAYLSSKSYLVGNLALFNGNVYRCITNTTGTFDDSKWDLLGAQGAIFYAQTPYPQFDLNGTYKVGDLVYWNNKVYSCKQPTTITSNQGAIQYRLVQNIPYGNVFPDDASVGAQYWTYVSTYTVPANTDILNTTFWTLGDNRDQQLVMYLIDIALYHVLSRIAPNNIPQLRITRYDSAVSWLRMCAEGAVTPRLPVVQPKQGARIRWGGNVKNINTY